MQTDIKGIHILDNILNEFLENFQTSASIGPEFCYWTNTEKIEYSLVVTDVADEEFKNFTQTLVPEVKCDIFLLSLFHELGHHMTIDNWSDEEGKTFVSLKRKIDYDYAHNTRDKKEILNEYFNIPDEKAATLWGLQYIKSHAKEISALWERIHAAIMLIYELNEMEI